MKNSLEDGCVVPGAGAYEVAVHLAIRKGLNELKGKARLGLQAYADAMLVIPKTLAQNAGEYIFSCISAGTRDCYTRRLIRSALAEILKRSV